MDDHDKIEALILQSKLDDAFKLILETSRTRPNIRVKLLNLQSQHSRLKEERLLHTNDGESKLNSIIESLIYFNNQLKESETSDVYPKQKLNFTIISIILFIIVFLLIYLLWTLQTFKTGYFTKIDQLEKKIEMLPFAEISDVDSSFSKIIQFDKPISLWNNSVLLKTKTHYSGINLTFEGIKWVHEEAKEPQKTVKLITTQVGDQFYLQRLDSKNSIWGVNVISKNSAKIELEFFKYPSKN